MGIHTFSTKNDQKFGEGIPMFSLPLRQKLCVIFWESLMKNVGKILGILMSLEGVHLISGITPSFIPSCRNQSRTVHEC